MQSIKYTNRSGRILKFQGNKKMRNANKWAKQLTQSPSSFFGGQVAKAIFFHWVFSTIPLILLLNSVVLTSYCLVSQEGHLTKVLSIQFKTDAEYDHFPICLRITSHPLILKRFWGVEVVGTFQLPPQKMYTLTFNQINKH